MTWWTVLRSLTVGIHTSMRVGISPMQSTSGRGTSSSSDSLIALHTQQINTGVFISFIANFLPSEDHNCKQYYTNFVLNVDYDIFACTCVQEPLSS